MFYYTSNKPISQISLPFSCLLILFLLLPVHFTSFVFYIYTFSLIILICTNSIYCCKQLSFWCQFSIQCTLLRFLYLHEVFPTPQNIVSLLRVNYWIFLLKPLCQQFHHSVLLQVVIFGQMDMTKLVGAVLQLYSAHVPNN